MADQEQLTLLKQGHKDWNLWRRNHPDVMIDLKEANLEGADLRGADLRGANIQRAFLTRADLWQGNLDKANLIEARLKQAHLKETDLNGADLWGADLWGADLWRAHLKQAHLREADLREAFLTQAELLDANLTEANLTKTNFTEANLTRADLTGADLAGANLTGAILTGTNFANSIIHETVFGNNDLSRSLGLESILHYGPSTMGMDTYKRSKGKIPLRFLRGCGLNDWEIEAAKLYDPDLSNQEINDIQYRVYDLRARRALQISPLFISYSHDDSAFVNKLEEPLNASGIRFWRDIHDVTAGRLEKQIDDAIRHNPTVLLVLSKNSLKSDWVEHEVNLARRLEKEIGRDVLCPVALDDTWKKSTWSQVLMEQVMKYYILDYSCWEDDNEFKRIFVKLVDGLNLYYRKDK